MTEELQRKVDRAVKLIQSAAGQDVVEVSYSGGKDSDVILELARMAGIKYRAIYKNTTIDPPGTIKHCRDNGVEVLQPTISFFKLVEKKGMPTRRARFCCEKLKEYKVLDKAIQGIHPLYYDEQGTFHPERRLGCMGCPLRSDAGLSEFKATPRLLRLLVKATKVWWDNNPQLKSHKKFGSVYGLVAHNLLYKSYADWQAADNNLFERMDWKKMLEQYFGIDLP